MPNQKGQSYDKQSLKKNIIRDILREALFITVGIMILLFSAGNISWEYTWIYAIITILVSAIGAFIMPPELLSERGRKKDNAEKWDIYITKSIPIIWLSLYLVSGLDFRFGWFPELVLPIHITATIIYVSGLALQLWSMRANAYFSSAVRIQYDRGQTVSTSGPYRYIRHPGYLGIITYCLSTPIILGSTWALIPAGAIIVLLIIRTALEDQTLRNMLEGYKGYADKVKYRLIPGVW